jgi:hypothetical protein
MLGGSTCDVDANSDAVDEPPFALDHHPVDGVGTTQDKRREDLWGVKLITQQAYKCGATRRARLSLLDTQKRPTISCESMDNRSHDRSLPVDPVRNGRALPVKGGIAS